MHSYAAVTAPEVTAVAPAQLCGESYTPLFDYIIWYPISHGLISFKLMYFIVSSPRTPDM